MTTYKIVYKENNIKIFEGFYADYAHALRAALALAQAYPNITLEISEINEELILASAMPDFIKTLQSQLDAML